MADNDRPLLTIVSGSGGSGKTTLATTLSVHLGLARIDRDGIANGDIFTHGRRAMPGDVLRDTVYTTLALWLSRGVSTVLDLTTYRGVTEGELLSRLPEGVTVINVHCKAETARERCRARLEAAKTPTRATAEQLDALFARYDADRPMTDPPPDFGGPQLEVDTTNGYHPTLDVVTSFVMSLGSPPSSST
jgi:predicted kinase